jgi:hypothetical protein
MVVTRVAIAGRERALPAAEFAISSALSLLFWQAADAIHRSTIAQRCKGFNKELLFFFAMERTGEK